MRNVTDPVKAGGRLTLGTGLSAVALVGVALLIVNSRESSSSSTSLPKGLAILGAVLAVGAILQGAIVCVSALRRKERVPSSVFIGMALGLTLLAGMAFVIAIALTAGDHFR